MAMQARLAGKRALITGGGAGLGAQMARRFHEEGAEVLVNDLRLETAEAVAKEVGGSALAADVSDSGAVREMFERVGREFGRLDVLVNNAGINKQGFMPNVTEADWDEIMDVNLKGPFLCSQEVFPIMEKQQSGRIINIASVSGLYGGPKTIHYAVSKAGLITMTQVFARYGAEHNIHVNAIAPGIIETDLTRDELRSGGGGVVVEMTLLKRPGQVEDVSSAAVFLASDSQNYMTGQTISPNGGSYFTR